MSGASPCDELRAAAVVIRARAEAATPGPWGTDSDIPAVVYSDVRAGATVAHTTYSDDHEHIATWSPPVALAVANLLSEAALDVIGLAASRAESLAREALVIARLVNGGAA